jgi:hypothetical protein
LVAGDWVATTLALVRVAVGATVGAVVEVAEGKLVAVSVGFGVLVGGVVLVGSGVLLGWAVSVAATDVATAFLLAASRAACVAERSAVGADVAGAEVGAAAGDAQALRTRTKIHNQAGRAAILDIFPCE